MASAGYKKPASPRGMWPIFARVDGFSFLKLLWLLALSLGPAIASHQYRLKIPNKGCDKILSQIGNYSPKIRLKENNKI
jgi:hypothetical protein